MNPKLCMKTCLKFPFDAEVLRWGLPAMSREDCELLDKRTAYVPMVNALTLNNLGLQKTMRPQVCPA